MDALKISKKEVGFELTPQKNNSIQTLREAYKKNLTMSYNMVLLIFLTALLSDSDLNNNIIHKLNSLISV